MPASSDRSSPIVFYYKIFMISFSWCVNKFFFHTVCHLKNSISITSMTSLLYYKLNIMLSCSEELYALTNYSTTYLETAKCFICPPLLALLWRSTCEMITGDELFYIRRNNYLKNTHCKDGSSIPRSNQKKSTI